MYYLHSHIGIRKGRSGWCVVGRGGAWWGVEGVDGTWESRRTR